MKEKSQIVAYAPSDPVFDRKFVMIAYTCLILAIILFTYLHHFQPQVLNVPSNTDVSSWVNPSFEHTCIYDRMTGQEKDKILAEGIPGATVSYFVFLDISALLVALLCYFHCRKHYGLWMATCFLVGSFIFTGMQESMWILFGRFTGMSAMQGINEQVYGTYWFTKGGLWFIETPVAMCLGWFYVAYGCVWMAGKAFPKSSLLMRAIIGGLRAMIVDLWMDPVATSPENMTWVWATGDFVRLFGIPHTNFMGWFFLIFCFAIFWEWLPRWEKLWGRARATGVFFLTLIVTEVAILAFMFPWCFLLRTLLVLAGFDHGLQIPPGW